jgi:hypothetical protein
VIFVRARSLAAALVVTWLAAAASLGAGCGSGGDTNGTTGDASVDVTAGDEASDETSPTNDAAGDAPDSAPFATAPHRPWPQLLPHTGHVLAPLTLVSIVTQGDPLASGLFAFGDALPQSAWVKAAGDEYGVGAVTGHTKVTGPALATAPDRAGLLQYITDLVANGTAPAPDGKTLYVVYLPAGILLTGTTFASFHGPYPSLDAGLGDGYAVVARQTPPTGDTQLDLVTNIASHEIIEAATDTGSQSWRLPLAGATPWDASVWSSLQSGSVENGDLCERTRTREGSYQYQRSWSNAAALDGGDHCVPPLAAPYVNVSAPADWYPVQPGQSVDVPFTGWSTGPTGNWLVSVVQTNGGGALHDAGLGLEAGVSVATDLGLGTKSPCFSRQAMNNGTGGTVTVTVPPAVASGDWAVLSIRSFHEDPATCYQPPTDDLSHAWLVGIFVP